MIGGWFISRAMPYGRIALTLREPIPEVVIIFLRADGSEIDQTEVCFLRREAAALD